MRKPGALWHRYSDKLLGACSVRRLLRFTATMIVFISLGMLSSCSKKLTRTKPPVDIMELGEGWASNSVNAVIFRKSAITSFRDRQYASWYNAEGYVMLATRKLPSKVWTVKRTEFKGNVADAHNAISIMVDGRGVLHMSWDHHNNALNYARARVPESIEMGAKEVMTGRDERYVSYPEFYRMPDGSLLFFYRNGGSGKGELVMNRYDLKTSGWQRLQSSLIDGEGQRSPYTQTCVDASGIIHISWVWRESPDVASNHDMCYARSRDGGKTWERSDGTPYTLPIRAANAEYALKIPQNSQLINQTSMCSDSEGNPYIVSYWQKEGRPQYQLIYKDSTWKTRQLGFRKGNFNLNGMGTKSIPISRPLAVLLERRGKKTLIMLSRDAEQGNVLEASCLDLTVGRLSSSTLYSSNLGSWEPTIDQGRWDSHKVLSVFLQPVQQQDAEGLKATPASRVSVLEWKP